MLVTADVVASELPLRNTLTVVKILPGSHAAATYYERFNSNKSHSPDETTAPPALLMRDRLPLMPTLMRPGKPSFKPYQGLYTPIFVIGMDALSLRWLERRIDRLAELGARGWVVQADNTQAWDLLQRRAAQHGVELQLMPDAVIAEGYDVVSYPVVIGRDTAELGRSLDE